MVLASPRLGAEGDDPLTMAQASSQVQDAIDFAELAAQNAPPGHAIYQAIADAKAAKAWIDSQIPFFSGGSSPPLPHVTAKVREIVSEVYDAAANIVDDGSGLTQYTNPSPPIPWAFIGAGAVALAGGAWLLFGRKRARA